MIQEILESVGDKAEAKADIGLVCLSEKMSSNNYPLKMLGYMQLAKPILASVNKNNERICF